MKNQDRYKTILVIVIGFITISWILEIKQFQVAASLFFKIGFVVGAASIVSQFFAKWIEWSWLKFALGLGWVNSRILLSIIYFIFLLPIALISRLFTNDPLQLKKNLDDSVYTTRDHTYTKEDLENIW